MHSMHTRGCSKKAGKMQEHTFKPSTIPHASLRRGIVRRFVLRDSAATAKCVRMNEWLGVVVVVLYLRLVVKKRPRRVKLKISNIKRYFIREERQRGESTALNLKDVRRLRSVKRGRRGRRVVLAGSTTLS